MPRPVLSIESYRILDRHAGPKERGVDEAVRRLAEKAEGDR